MSRLMGLTNKLNVSATASVLEEIILLSASNTVKIMFLSSCVNSECNSQSGSTQCGVWGSAGCPGDDGSTHGSSLSLWTLDRFVSIKYSEWCIINKPLIHTSCWEGCRKESNVLMAFFNSKCLDLKKKKKKKIHKFVSQLQNFTVYDTFFTMLLRVNQWMTRLMN